MKIQKNPTNTQITNNNIETATPLTRHAMERMCKRHIPEAAIDAVLQYGRAVNVRRAIIYAIGRKEVAYFKKLGIKLSTYEGIQVVCASSHEVVITAYRNQNFRKLRFH